MTNSLAVDKLSVSHSITSVIHDLTRAFVYKKFLSKRIDIDFSRLKKAGWICSILAESENEVHKQQAQVFAILLHLYGGDKEEYDKLSYVILSRVGNLLSTKFLTSLFNNNIIASNNFRYEFGQLLNIELASDRIGKIIQINDNEVLTTSFQLDLWNKLYSDKNISISAPTSAGKSYIIQNFIQDYYFSNANAQGLYIVPTKALINQASDDLRRMLKETNVRTSFIEDESIENPEGESLYQPIPSGRIIYVLTPERCLRLLEKSEKAKFSPNIIFIDEIQNIEDTGGHGALFEFVLESISVSFPSAKIITAGPFINNEKAVFEEIFNLPVTSCVTSLPPVFQLQTIIRNTKSDNKLDLFVNDTAKSEQFKISIDVDFSLAYELSLNKGVAFAKTIRALVPSSSQQSLVYCPKTNLAESWALKLEEYSQAETELSDELQELIDFIATEIHPKYYLIKCLKKNIAFHHSRLPDIVRKEVEDLFKQGDISVLYCTATLLQGVNLPAHNLFITSPKKRTLDLSSFEFGNLIGRAGRIRDSLYGVVYCIEDNEDAKQWAETFYNASYTKDIIPATRKALQNTVSIVDNADKSSVDIRDEQVASVLTTLRHKYIHLPEGFSSYLYAKKLNQEDILKLLVPIRASLESVTLPREILRLNPGIDPLLQSVLYEVIKKEGIVNWVIVYNGSNFYKRIKQENIVGYKYDELSFYWQFNALCEKLDYIFQLSSESFFKHDIGLPIKVIAYSGYRWLTSTPLKEIISSDINYHVDRFGLDANDDKAVNKRISAVINIQSKIVTFMLAKYFKLLSDLLNYIMNDEEREKYKFTLSLPLMIELGTTEPYVIQLISAGITRSVALQIFNEFKKIRGFKELDIILWIQDSSNLIGISKVSEEARVC
ncbi:DEAD/DEAH box helicase [Hymenobacter sp. J193]|uniref:DEAD/DEAH box helicase n=1 Tax=Hymenobacter sp. J193 TaxID=2898429 RepID=UPI0021509208|nr:DEAD/DEAH box helicase [Hymenobacter sp. J193]MCR5889255.1 DEAD/DEAH box helicase [Hymenobacter sp. J193]